MSERSQRAQPAALPNAASRIGFNSVLEAEFGRLQLAENRTLIRVTALVALALAAARGAE